jgi:NAD(P)-dependent dehydrogenase (short-subunit alcohol dehydrogenase family)
LAKARVATAHIPSGLELLELDLASLASVRAAADALVADGRKFDVVIANAGIMAVPQGKTKDGFEMQFGTNYLGHFVLLNRLARLLAPGGRVVNLTSAGHRYSDVDLEDPNFEHTEYNEFIAYGRSKTANILFTVEFDRRHRDAGVRATAVHPGAVYTELGRYMAPEVIAQLFDSLKADEATGAPALQWKVPAQGAATSVWAGFVAAADAVGGRYCEDCHVAEIAGGDDVRGGGVQAYALDAERAKALWALGEALVGERF